MFIAHLPAGYILAKKLYQKFPPSLISKRIFFIAVLAGSIFPDLDLFYFYFIDARSVHHHYYFFHWPLPFLSIGIISALLYFFSPQVTLKKIALICVLFCSAVMLHIILDTFVGDIWWFMPFIDQPYALFEVPAVQSHWILNFVLHWSFIVELIICIYSLRLFLKG